MDDLSLDERLAVSKAARDANQRERDRIAAERRRNNGMVSLEMRRREDFLLHQWNNTLLPEFALLKAEDERRKAAELKRLQDGTARRYQREARQ
jgi:hypothetical protein